MKRAMSMILIAMLAATIGSTMGLAGVQAAANPVVHVGWNVTNTTEDMAHQYQDSQWIFGPQPNIWIGYADNSWNWNGTDIASNQYRVDAGNKLLVNITIPYGFLPSGAILDVVSFWGQTQAVKKAVFGLQYNATSGTWNSLNLHYKQGVDKPPESGFLTLNATHSLFFNSSASRSYTVVFAIVFNLAVVKDVFSTGMQVVDKDGRPVSPVWLAKEQSGAYGSPPLGLGMPVPPSTFMLPRYYYAEVVGDDSRIIHYVDYGDNFTFRLVANVPFGEVMIPFCALSVANEYMLHFPWHIPVDMYNPATAWVNETDMPLFLVFMHNGTGTFALPGYLWNISWTWIPIIGQWSVNFDIKLNYTIDISKFYDSLYAQTSFGGAEIRWKGHFEKAVDMNMDQYDVGGSIKPDPYFWKVFDVQHRILQPREEITKKNTVQLAFRMQFIEAYVRDLTGEIVEQASKNQILNLTLNIHSPAGKVNGSYYIVVNKTNVPVAVGNSTLQIDIDGIRVDRLRQNVTVSLQGGGIWSNDTHVITYTVVHDITIDLVHHTMSNISFVVLRLSNRNTGAFITQTTFTSTKMVRVFAWRLNVAEGLSQFWLLASFTDLAPSIKIDKAAIVSSLFEHLWMNASLHGANTYGLVYMGNQSSWETSIDNVVWTPRRLLIGDVFAYEQQAWAVTENGAIDLDGNAFTTDDQYFVLRTGTWKDWGNTTTQGMGVTIVFDPTPGSPGNEFVSQTWMGVVKMIINFQANESFYWYHPNGTPVSLAEMNRIRDTMWAAEGNVSAPGYDWVAWMSLNRTIDLSRVPGLKSGSWSNTWFAWGTVQAFQVSTSAAKKEWAAFRAHYAGLLLFRDLPGGQSEGAPDFHLVNGQVVTDEVTHFVLIDSVGSVELRRPLGSTADNGTAMIPPETPVNFGITIRNVNVTIYPLRVENSNGIRGAWQIRQSYEGAVGLNSTSFDYWITPATITEMSFDVSFHVNMVNYSPTDPTRWNHAVVFKISQRFGNWTLRDFDNSVLEGRSLAVNFFAVLGTATRTEYRAGAAQVTDTNGASMNASFYEFRAADSPFANVTMGGLPYTWGGDNHSVVYTSGSSTAPIGAFSAMYESASGDTVTNWKVEASMLFMTAGYDHWGGHDVICDPVFISYSTAHPAASSTTTTTTHTTTTPTTTSTPIGSEAGLYILIGGVVAVIVIVMVLVRRR